MSELKPIINFLFETGILAKTPRSGFHFLGTGEQSVAEHTHRAVYIGYALSQMTPGVDHARVLKMCLLHDLPEARTTDLNYLHQKYAEAKTEKAITDLVSSVPFGEDLKSILAEYETRESEESKLAKDADTLEWIFSLKEQLDIGNQRAKEWIEIAKKRLKTTAGKSLGEEVVKIDSNDWWFAEKEDSWWVSRNKD